MRAQEGLLGRGEIEKDFPALVEVLKRFLDFGNRIDRCHRNGQRAGGDKGCCLDLRGEHLRDVIVVASRKKPLTVRCFPIS